MVARLTAAALLTAVLGGCSFDLPSMAGASSADDITTGSLPSPADTQLAPELGPEDLRRAKAALAVALNLQGNGAGMKWNNPESKLHGEVSPAGRPFVERNEVCRRFLATVQSSGGRTSLHEGQACKVSADEWALKAVRHSQSR